MLRRTAARHHSHRWGPPTAAHALLLLLWSWAALGDPTFYVDFNTPNPNGSGASGAPFKTLEDAVESTQGDVELEFKRGASGKVLVFPRAGTSC